MLRFSNPKCIAIEVNMQGAVKIFMWTPLNQCQLDVQGEGGGIRFALLPFAGQEGSKTYITRVGRSVGMIIAITSSVMRVTKKRYYLNRVKLLEKKPSCTLSADKYR